MWTVAVVPVVIRIIIVINGSAQGEESVSWYTDWFSTFRTGIHFLLPQLCIPFFLWKFSASSPVCQNFTYSLEMAGNSPCYNITECFCDKQSRLSPSACLVRFRATISFLHSNFVKSLKCADYFCFRLNWGKFTISPSGNTCVTQVNHWVSKIWGKNQTCNNKISQSFVHINCILIDQGCNGTQKGNGSKFYLPSTN